MLKKYSHVVGEIIHIFYCTVILELLKSAKWCDLYTETEIIQLEALRSKCLAKKLEF